MIYKVKITEVLSKVVEVEAESASKAEFDARSLYYNEEVVLDWVDFDKVSFEVISSERKELINSKENDRI